MKKFLLSLLTLLTCIGASAKGIYEFALGDELTLAQAAASETGFVLVSGNQVLGIAKDGEAGLKMYNINDVAVAYMVKLEAISGVTGTSETEPNAYHILMYKPNATKIEAGNRYGVFGDPNCSLTAVGWGDTWVAPSNADRPDGRDFDYSSRWNFEAQDDGGFAVYFNNGEGRKYLNGGNISDNLQKVWHLHPLTKKLVANTTYDFTKISFEDAKVSTDPVVLVQNDLVLCNNNGGANYGSKSDFDEASYWVKFEAADAANNQYYITLNKDADTQVGYLNASGYSHVFISNVDKNGTKGEKQNGAIFIINSLGDNQYSIQNLGGSEGSYDNYSGNAYMTFTTTDYWKGNATWHNEDPSVWEFYTVTDRKVVPIDPNTPTYDKVEADLTTFALEKLKDNNWHFNTPVDLFDYKYLVVVTKEASGNKNGYMILTDNTGKRAGNNWGSDLEINYVAEAAGTRGGMWLDRWNNQICACINLAWIREQGLDIRNITNFSVPNGANIAGVFLTNYAAGNGIKKEGGPYPTGDHQRTNGLLSEETAKFGTVALKYTSVVSGAKLYTVDSFDAESGIVLAEKSDYIAEAGVPYIFLTCDFEGKDADGGKKGTASNVNFFRVDAKAIYGDWSDNNDRDNGLVGYYDNGFLPGADALKGNGKTYLLSQNELHLIDGGDITLGTNRCFFDAEKYQGPKSSAGAKVRVAVSGVEETAIKAIENTLKSDKIFDLNGREVKSMQPGGVYIMGGMKVRVK